MKPALWSPLLSQAHQVFISETMSKLPNGASLAPERNFFIAAAPSTCREWMITIPWKPFRARNRAISLPVPLKMELSACIQCKSWSRKMTLNSSRPSAWNAASAFLAKTALGKRCRNQEMRSSVSSTTRTDQLVGMWNCSHIAYRPASKPLQMRRSPLRSRTESDPGCGEIHRNSHSKPVLGVSKVTSVTKQSLGRRIRLALPSLPPVAATSRMTRKPEIIQCNRGWRETNAGC